MPAAMEPPAKGEVNSIVFTDNVCTDYRLLEVDDDMIDEIMTRGLTIKGGEKAEAVLCTHNKTYAVKQVETTNALYLIPPKHDVDLSQMTTGTALELEETMDGHEDGFLTQVSKLGAAKRKAHLATAKAAATLELVEIAPQLEILEAMLWEHPYGGADEASAGGDDDDDEEAWEAMEGTAPKRTPPPPRGYTFQQLLSEVPASEEQLRAALRTQGAIEIAGRWRVVDPQYIGQLLEILLLTCVERDWPLSAVPLGGAVAALRPEGYAPSVIRHCLATYGAACGAGGAGAAGGAEEGAEGAGEERYAMGEEHVCMHFAKKLFESQRRNNWVAADFLARWRESVPAEMQGAPSLSMLKGVALEERGRETLLKPFFDSWLPVEPGARFQALFAERAQWPEEDLAPYLKSIRFAPGQTVEGVLLKYTRCSQPQPDAPPVYHRR